MKRMLIFLLASLLACPLCGAMAEDAAPEAGRTSFHYYSAYDTATPELLLEKAGAYRAGDDFAAGIYTAVPDADCDGELVIAAADGSELHRYDLRGASGYSFYLAEGMRVTLPEHCALRALRYELLFQDQTATETFANARFFVMMELPGFVYNVTALPGEEAYCVLSPIAAELGQETPSRVEVPAGETVRLVLQEQYDVFVEFHNCVVTPAEVGVG